MSRIPDALIVHVDSYELAIVLVLCAAAGVLIAVSGGSDKGPMQ